MLHEIYEYAYMNVESDNVYAVYCNNTLSKNDVEKLKIGEKMENDLLNALVSFIYNNWVANKNIYGYLNPYILTRCINAYFTDPEYYADNKKEYFEYIKRLFNKVNFECHCLVSIVYLLNHNFIIIIGNINVAKKSKQMEDIFVFVYDSLDRTFSSDCILFRYKIHIL
jgi:hypothetical protein